MSAVPPESQESQASPAGPDFGPNEWLVDELYQRYLADPSSVAMEWWNFFADYQPPPGSPVPPAAAVTSGPAAPAPGPAAPGSPGAGPGTGGQADGAQADGARAAGAQAAGAQAAGARAAGPQAAGTQAAGTQPAGPGAGAPGTGARGPAGSAPAIAAPAGPGSAAAPPAGQPVAPAAPAQPAPDGKPAAPPAATAADGTVARLRGAAARTADNMAASLTVPTATSVRAIPAKLLADNRIVINNHLARGRGGKVSFTHLIGYAILQALRAVPEMNHAFTQVDGKPGVVTPEHVNLGLAIDVTTRDGSRQLLVPSIKAAEAMDFRQFWMAYEDIVRRARTQKLTVDDYAGTTITLTNPGTIGTEHSVPRLMAGQGCIVGVGAMEYPAEYLGASQETLARLAVSKTVTLTSTYDHRIIQGAQSGEFLRRMQQLLLGEDGFYDTVFRALHIPYEPVRWYGTSPPCIRKTSPSRPGCSSSSTPTGSGATSWRTPTRWSTSSASTRTWTSTSTA